MKCPGQDTRYWKSEDIFIISCPNCNTNIEFFKDDVNRKCAGCGLKIANPKIELGCALYCEFASKCLDKKE